MREHPILLKASGISNLADARYFSAAGAKILTFELEQDQPDYINPEKAASIVEWLSGPSFVAHFNSPELSVILALKALIPLQFVQVPFEKMSDPLINYFSGVITSISLEAWHQMENHGALNNQPDYWLIELPETNFNDCLKNHSRAIEFLKESNHSEQIILGANYPLSELKTVSDFFPRCGLDIRCSFEMSQGLNAFDEVEALLHELQTEVD